MNLHKDKKLFSDLLRAASQHLDIKLEFVEKDYWISLLLHRLAKSKYASVSVFKGGTSLSKGYNMIERFSEDVDIAIVHDEDKSANEIKTIIRNIEKEITNDLLELPTEGITSKGSRFRKSVFEYPGHDRSVVNNKLIVEINSFANPFPYKELILQSMVYDFLSQTGNEIFINQYNLSPFELNVLNKEQTLIEKMVSLIRFSYHENIIYGISGKIRHFYDIYFLLNDPACENFVKSGVFKKEFEKVLSHDKSIFKEPIGWEDRSLSESPLVNDFDNIWNNLKEKYQTELSAFAYRPIPDAEIVAKRFKELLKRIQ